MKTSPRSNGLIRTLTVYRTPRLPGRLAFGGRVKVGMDRLPCALGGSGTRHAKREGDKATPFGTMAILHGFYRPDVMRRPLCRIPLRPLQRNLGWCDDPSSPLYNRAHVLPLSASHEIMWRKDGLYDLVFVLDYNIQPRRVGRGSAIFLHCAKSALDTKSALHAKSGLAPTLGCVALRPADMRRLVPRLAPGARIIVR